MPAGALSSIPPSPPMARHRSSFSTQAGESAASLYSAASDRGVVESGQVLIPRGGALGAGARETRRIEEASESLESESAAEQRGSIQDEDQKAKRISSELTLGVRAYAGERFMRAAEVRKVRGCSTCLVIWSVHFNVLFSREGIEIGIAAVQVCFQACMAWTPFLFREARRC